MSHIKKQDVFTYVNNHCVTVNNDNIEIIIYFFKQTMQLHILKLHKNYAAVLPTLNKQVLFSKVSTKMTVLLNSLTPVSIKIQPDAKVWRYLFTATSL